MHRTENSEASDDSAGGVRSAQANTANGDEAAGSGTHATSNDEPSAGGTRPTALKSPVKMRGPTWLVDRVRGYGLIVVVAVYGVLLFAWLFPQDLRSTSRVYLAVAWWVMLVRTFVFHIGLVMLVVTVAAGWCRLRRLVVATVPVLLFALVPALWQSIPHGAAADSDRTFRVLTANLYWNNANTVGIVGEIVEAKADIVVLVEYTPHWHKVVHDAIGANYPHQAIEVMEDMFGLAVYSRFPFVGQVDLSVPLGGASFPQARAVVDVNGAHVVLYGLHLMAPRNPGRLAANRVMVADLVEHLDAERLPVMVVGDFNFTPTSAQAAALRRIGFVEAHAGAGWGRGSTWSAWSYYRFLPGVRLDQVYVRGGLSSVDSRTGVGVGSDHRPVIVDLAY